MKKNNTQLLQLKFFSTKIKPKEIIDSKKFIQVIQKQKKNLYNKDFLLGNMTFNVIYFCISRRELNNAAAHIPLILKINTYLIANTYNLFLLNISINKIFKLVKFNDFLVKKKFFVKFNFLLKENFIWLYNSLLSLTTKTIISKKQKSFLNKNINHFSKNLDLKKTTSVKAFLFVWGTRNNFFVTIVDNKGNTLVTWTGGNSEWTGTRQRSSVYSADNAIYEACFLAWQRGVESLSVHLLSTFRLPQIKNTFEGLETADLNIDELVYRPIQVIGGCRQKKPWRV